MFRYKSKFINDKTERSLNFPLRRREYHRIENENAKFVRRLMEKLPSINIRDFDRDYKRYMGYKSRLLKLNLKINELSDRKSVV